MAVIRATRAALAAWARAAPSRVLARFVGWRLDLSGRGLVSPSGEAVRLTAGEFDVLAVFVANTNRPLSHDHLLDLTRNREAGPFDRTIDVQVGRLALQARDDPQMVRLIKTMRSGGHVFSTPIELS